MTRSRRLFEQWKDGLNLDAQCDAACGCALNARTMRSSGSLVPPAIFSWNILTMASNVHEPPTSPNMESNSDSSMSLPTLSKAARKSFLLKVPSLSTSISLKHSLYMSICSWEKPPSLLPLPMVVVDDDQDFSEIIEDRGPESWTAR